MLRGAFQSLAANFFRFPYPQIVQRFIAFSGGFRP